MKKTLLLFLVIVVLVFAVFFVVIQLLGKEITIVTDKKDYEQGEKIEIVIINNTIRGVEYKGCGVGKYQFPLCWLGLEKLEEEMWVSIRGSLNLSCPCGFMCEPPPFFILESGENIVGEWDQIIWWCEKHEMGVQKKEHIIPGRYRLVYKEWKKVIHSNEFIIK